ncbi:MAG: DUF4145 domain-containing protein [Bacteroidetes bacterium]|nr:DUF4145 domain-containing protein [Bacteroidota bacterium]
MFLLEILELDRCPHCNIYKPGLRVLGVAHSTSNNTKSISRIWRFYDCPACGGVVCAYARKLNELVIDYFPKSIVVSDILPMRVKSYLEQAINSIGSSPSGAIMLCASAVDSMLKEKGLKEGKLYPRIKEAVQKGIITEDMSKWAHQVRLDANEQRHADESNDLPDTEDATKCIQFTQTLAEIMFILPYKVNQGINESKDNN